MSIKKLKIEHPITLKEFKVQQALGTLNLDILFKLAEDHNTYEEILIILSKSDKLEIRSCVAQNHNTPVEILEKLSEDINYFVRLGVYRNPATPLEIIQQMKKHESKYD